MSSSDKRHSGQFYLYLVDAGPLLTAMIDINESDKTTMTTIYLRSGPLIFIYIYHLHSTSTQVLSELNDIDQKNISLYTSTLVLRQSLEIRNYPPSFPVNTWHEAQLATCSRSAVLLRSYLEGEDFTITEKAPTRAFSWLKAPISAFTFKTVLIKTLC